MLRTPAQRASSSWLPTIGLINIGSINTIASVEVTNSDGNAIKAGLPANATITLGVGTADFDPLAGGRRRHSGRPLRPAA